MALTPYPTRQDTHVISFTVDRGPGVGKKDYGTWDTKSGGEIDSEENKYKPGGMEKEFSLGGTKTFGNVTIGRYFDYNRDDATLAWLLASVGSGRGSVGIQMLDAYGAPQGSQLTYGGTIKTVTPPELDSTSNDAAIVEVEVTVDTVSYQ